MSAEFKAGWNARGPEVAALTAHLQAAQATIAEIVEWRHNWFNEPVPGVKRKAHVRRLDDILSAVTPTENGEKP